MSYMCVTLTIEVLFFFLTNSLQPQSNVNVSDCTELVGKRI